MKEFPVVSALYNWYPNTVIIGWMENKFEVVKEMSVINSFIIIRRIQPYKRNITELIKSLTFISFIMLVGWELND